ncbi:hypothetical protein [Paracoccus marinaquae]|uniref:Glyceraldehyde-3-phosphate dehydrogenase n=1 Tax=Paracoccus marinaquae TaxID=2841926 RepID=A0ABS6AHT7_9RHOB|nr:hypothetical protein [Paracoccus marinaquae]MBU3029230.1 hypothetical protein [Paracoccus marinaquae]
MTNKIAILLAVMILAIFAADHFWLNLDLPVRVGKVMNGFIEYLSFWR